MDFIIEGYVNNYETKGMIEQQFVKLFTMKKGLWLSHQDIENDIFWKSSRPKRTLTANFPEKDTKLDQEFGALCHLGTKFP